MSSLGIYFGPKSISVVETKNKKVINHSEISNAAYAISGLETKVPEEIKIVALLKETLRKNKIESKDATVMLSGKDLIIRTFGIPILPANELSGAINFEAKKYIPFKIEDLIFDFQTHLDRVNKSYSVLFVGIKKEILEKYFSILNQLNIKIASIEYSPFSIIRLMELTGNKNKGVIGVINIDSKEGDGADFTVLENGFPLFSCDIKFTSSLQDISSATTLGQDVASIDKLKSEIRISLDYYNHKFPIKKIKQMFLIGSFEYLPNIEVFLQELNLQFRFIDPSKVILGKQPPFSLSFLKAYCGSMLAAIKSTVSINILSAWDKSKRLKAAVEHPSSVLLLLLTGVKLNPVVVICALLIGSSGYVYGLVQKTPLQKELNRIVATHPGSKSMTSQSYDELGNTVSQYKSNIGVLDALLKQQLYLTPQLSVIPVILPKGLWLEIIIFSTTEKGGELNLTGRAYFDDRGKESVAVNNFLIALKKQECFRYMKNMEIVSMDTAKFQEKTVTNFKISGHN